ncbi:HNH endonuclease [Vibrio genomosp. F10]|uniref:HNH endonuclease n=1 Tax=Vibrio genomosp. F10 TaxID=723171 RepID=UPI0002ECB6AD|nr:HNH endonuclease signature motif containing protein [Vibrio genomosp. F10]OEE84647.1 hypothetical protein A1QK_03975 [Vibrio genomosp. F10 str. 9ZD137]OEF04609.1 hypothetical protein A1QI_11120 [Vibrio genomosp. F10 str. 9ZB36]
MKLTVSFGSLIKAVDQMEPDEKGDFLLEFQETSIDKLDLELAEGKDVELKDVDVGSGLLSYKGRQVLLYIKDHGGNAQSVINTPGTGNRYHVSDCSTLKKMRAEGRFERYVATNDVSGEFTISGSKGYLGSSVEGKAKLKVCQNCLTQLNYKSWTTGGNRGAILSNFNMAEFFQTYSSFFPHMPSRKSDTAETDYTDDWAKVSSHYRVEQDFQCEECKVNMRSNRALLHVHHINGVKPDNSINNLKALCIDCHSKQPFHSHMALRHSERQLINQLRKEQGLLENVGGWSELFSFADPGVHGVLHACQRQNFKLPEVAYYVRDEFDDLISKVELAWPDVKFGIAISKLDIEEANECGWEIVSVNDFLEGYKTNANHLRKEW